MYMELVRLSTREKRMTPTIADKLEITELMNGWMFRDKGDWERLSELFHEEGTIEVTWFEGAFTTFIDASRRMGVSALKTKHFVGTPLIEFADDRAIAETNAIIICDNATAGVGCNAHARLYDELERRDDKWRILTRRCIYDMGNLTSTPGADAIDAATFNRFPREYAALAYVLEISGFPVKRVFPTRNSELEVLIKEEAQRWLRRA
jgi:hypothetical protein